jgi:hypothetical protein
MHQCQEGQLRFDGSQGGVYVKWQAMQADASCEVSCQHRFGVPQPISVRHPFVEEKRGLGDKRQAH